ncbi:hypothetical protein [Candidatus Xianfuyuplasma coldseepsis]|uniref:Uncharacterized protein n=1 Tax=Candidatus Xianfuyuplasma coldseepsis TaxID=2782163 RepID=A0A7L7KRB3_9MOLU|nr:hypothetical protein [Xianfuyuplasma coldseepsis]QMS85273.1 hypothetical protein G4Z02_05755 [Xianfuyuplasma coldseepsis]
MEIDLSQLPRKVRRYDITEERGFRGKVYKHLIPYDNFERKSTVEILDELLSDWIGSLDKL